MANQHDLLGQQGQHGSHGQYYLNRQNGKTGQNIHPAALWQLVAQFPHS